MNWYPCDYPERAWDDYCVLDGRCTSCYLGFKVASTQNMMSDVSIYTAAQYTRIPLIVFIEVVQHIHEIYSAGAA